jgi:acyl carrier protein
MMMSPNPTPQEIERILLAEISAMIPEIQGITADMPLRTLGLDSLRLFELFILIEKQFGVTLLNGPLSREALENIAALSAHIASRIATPP